MMAGEIADRRNSQLMPQCASGCLGADGDIVMGRSGCVSRARAGAAAGAVVESRDVPLCPSRSGNRFPYRGRPAGIQGGCGRNSWRLVGAVALVSGVQMIVIGCDGLMLKPHPSEVGNVACVPPLQNGPRRSPRGLAGGALRPRALPAFFWRSANAASVSAGNTSNGCAGQQKPRDSFVCSQCKSTLGDRHSTVTPQLPAFPGSRSSAANAATSLKMSKESTGPGANDTTLRDQSQKKPRPGTRPPTKIRKLKVRTSVSETQLDRILRVGSLGSVNGTATLVRSIGGYQTLVAVKNAVDTTAGWRTPPLSGTQMVRRQSSLVRNKDGRPANTTADKKSQGKKYEWMSPAYATETAELLAAQQQAEALGETGAPTTPRALGPAWRQAALDSSDDSSSEDDVDEVLDIKRTILNIGLFVFTIGSWKGIWDAQDKTCLWPWPPGPCPGGMQWWTSVTIGIMVYIMRFKVDDILDTHDVHDEDWFELFSQMPQLSLGTAGEYGKIYLSSGLVFVSSLFIWRGVWAGFDAAGLSWFSTLVIGALGYLTLSVLQLELEIQRARDDPDGTRSSSLFAERDGLLTPPALVPEEYKKESDSSDAAEGVPGDTAPITGESSGSLDRRTQEPAWRKEEEEERNDEVPPPPPEPPAPP